MQFNLLVHTVHSCEDQIHGLHRLAVDELATRTSDDVLRQLFSIHGRSDPNRRTRRVDVENSPGFLLLFHRVVERFGYGRRHAEHVVLVQDRVHVIDQPIRTDFIDQYGDQR